MTSIYLIPSLLFNILAYKFAGNLNRGLKTKSYAPDGIVLVSIFISIMGAFIARVVFDDHYYGLGVPLFFYLIIITVTSIVTLFTSFLRYKKSKLYFILIIIQIIVSSLPAIIYDIFY